MTNFGVEVLGLAIKHALHVLGRQDIKLKQAQYDAIHSIVCGKKDVLAVLPTGFGKSLIYQCISPVFDFLEYRTGSTIEQRSLVIVVSPLNALIQDQIDKLKDKISVCIAKADHVISVEEGVDVCEVNQRKSSDEIPSKCQILFAHPEAIIEMREIRSTRVQKRVKAIIVDEAHLAVEW
jgi:ATP-dependent DNA helicase RecQ